jgi:hypothetical protein
VPNSADPSTAGRVNDPRDHATPADAVAVGPCAPAIPLNADVLLVEVRGTASGHHSHVTSHALNPDQCDFRVRYNPNRPSEAVAVHK